MAYVSERIVIKRDSGCMPEFSQVILAVVADVNATLIERIEAIDW